MSGILFGTPGTQSPKAYDLANLGGAVLAGRIGGAASATVRGNIRTALQDGAYLFKIHPAETAYGLTDAELTFGHIPGSVMRYGAKGDGITDDHAAIQIAIDIHALHGGPPAYVPEFTFLISTSLIERESTIIYGESEYNSIIKATAAIPLFVNDAGTANFQERSFRKLCLHGGTYAHEYTLSGSNVESLGEWESVRFENQSVAAISCNQYFLLNNFFDCAFFYCTSAIVSGNQANLNNWINCRFEGLNANSIEFNNTAGTNGGEVNSFFGCRFEARNGATGFTLLTVTQGICTVFDSCYFEDTWQHILSETGTVQGSCTKFRNCKFTGQENTGSGFQSEIFESDGVVGFENCFFLTGSSAASTCDYAPVGNNQGLNTSAGRIWRSMGAMVGTVSYGPRVEVTSKSFSPVSGAATSLFTVTRPTTTAGTTNNQTVAGMIRLVVSGSDSGGNPVILNYAVPFVVTGFSNAAMSANFGAAISAENNGPAATVAFGTTAAAAGAVTVTATLTLATLDNWTVRASVDADMAFNAGFGGPTLQMAA